MFSLENIFKTDFAENIILHLARMKNQRLWPTTMGNFHLFFLTNGVNGEN
jgi:hypothetical protein